MEDTLRGLNYTRGKAKEVLILVLMEDTLREAYYEYYNSAEAS